MFFFIHHVSFTSGCSLFRSIKEMDFEKQHQLCPGEIDYQEMGTSHCCAFQEKERLFAWRGFLG